jgi:glycosyltransferase involved in cell wall biosynthesis
MTRDGLLGRLPNLGRGPTVLLFYDGFELKLRHGLTGRCYAGLHHLARRSYRTVRGRQVWTGFFTAFRLLVRSLRRYGCDVRINALSLAAAHPSLPIGLAGYPTVLDGVPSPNPRLFGPGDFGYPDRAAEVARDPRIRILTQPSEWPVEYYRAACGDKLRVMFVGIDTDRWPDFSSNRKDLDVLIYDKIRWDKGEVRRNAVPDILGRITGHLDRLGLSYMVLRYGAHHLSRFRAALRRTRSMIFLCEHETQGLAYQEAMSCNVPIFALDEGVLVDPMQRRFADPALRVSSVPYFDASCGERFIPDNLEDGFARFWDRRQAYTPRQFVLRNLSMRQAAHNYLSLYTNLL